MTLNAILGVFLQGILYLALAPFTLGVLHWAEARLQNRQGPPVLQPYRDLRKLLRKRAKPPTTTSWLVDAAPAVVFICYACLGFILPSVYLPESGWRGGSDLLVLVFLLALARFTLSLAGMAAGSPLGGLGSGREMFLHALTEPTLILIVCTLALAARSTDFSTILQGHHDLGRAIYITPSSWLLLPALWIITLAEANRLPFDNPTSPLELTMFGKAIHLEYGGVQLAMLEWAEWARLTFLLTLVANLFAPWLMGTASESTVWTMTLVLIYPLKLALLALILASWETLEIKSRLRTLVTPALFALVLTLLAMMLVLAGGQYAATRLL